MSEAVLVQREQVATESVATARITAAAQTFVFTTV